MQRKQVRENNLFIIYANQIFNLVKYFRTVSVSGGICEGDKMPKIELIGNCDEGKIHLKENSMQEIYVQDLQNCPVKISTIHFPPSVILFSGN